MGIHVSANLKKSMAKHALRNTGWCTLLLAASRVMAGDVISGNVPSQPLTTPAAQDDLANSQMEVFVPSGAEGVKPLTDPFRYDNVVVRPHLDYQLQYGNGVQSAPGNPQASFIHTLAPGVRVDLGRFWSVDYTPTLRYYSNKDFKDEFDYTASLSGNTSYGDWIFGVTENISSSSAPLSETGTQTDQDSYDTVLTASYFFNDRLSTDLQVEQDLNYVTDPIGVSTNSASSTTLGTKQWSTLDWLNYTCWARLNVGIGAGAGYVESDTGINQIFEQVQARARWRATDKISFNLSGGFEDIQYTVAGFSDVLNPIFSATIQYQPVSVTQLSLTASRTISSSYYYILDQATENTQLSLDWSQQLLKKFTLDMTFSYVSEDYTTSIGKLSNNRSDTSYSFNAKLGHNFMRRGTWALTYQVTDSQSNQQGLGYNSTLYGFELTYRY